MTLKALGEGRRHNGEYGTSIYKPFLLCSLVMDVEKVIVNV